MNQNRPPSVREALAACIAAMRDRSDDDRAIHAWHAAIEQGEAALAAEDYDGDDAAVADAIADAIADGHPVLLGIGTDAVFDGFGYDYVVEPLALGWHCPKCRVFTGDAKEFHTECRSCGEARPRRIA